MGWGRDPRADSRDSFLVNVKFHVLYQGSATLASKFSSGTLTNSIPVRSLLS